MVKIYKQPFAHDGDAIAVPDASQPDGKVSNADGWTPDYQLPKTDPNYKPVGRQEMNGVFKEVTEALGQVQVQGAASWSPDGAPYPANAQTYHNGKQWLALRANSVEPAEGEDWTELVGKKYVDDLSPEWVADDPRAKTALNATGDTPIYACRAWVNFNGTGTVAIRASGNVSSITDNGVGDYTVNFTTAMPDANYSAPTSINIDGSAGNKNDGELSPYIYDISFIRLAAWNAEASGREDALYCNISIFR